MSNALYPESAGILSDKRKRLAPEVHDAFQTFGQRVFATLKQLCARARHMRS